MQNIHRLLLLLAVSGICVMSGCASTAIAPAHQLTAPEPILDNTGKYLCPYRQDGSLSDWSNKVIAKVLGGEAGKRAGFMLGGKLLGNGLGMDLGKKAGETAGQKLALEAAGGMEGIRRSSDISFNTLDDFSVYMYVKYSSRDDYKKALSACNEIYPALKKGYNQALVKATRESKSAQ